MTRATHSPRPLNNMGVSIHLENVSEPVGSASFLRAFFDTVTGNLEPQGRGSRFPVIAKRFYNGEIAYADADAALAELDVIVPELQNLSPENVIWDLDDRSKQPPWGSNIAPRITNLSNYFVTSSGKDWIAVLKEMLLKLRAEGGSITIG